MTSADWIALFKWLAPALPMLFEAMKKGEPVETVFALNRTAADAAFRQARERKLRQAEDQSETD